MDEGDGRSQKRAAADSGMMEEGVLPEAKRQRAPSFDEDIPRGKSKWDSDSDDEGDKEASGGGEDPRDGPSPALVADADAAGAGPGTKAAVSTSAAASTGSTADGAAVSSAGAAGAGASALTPPSVPESKAEVDAGELGMTPPRRDGESPRPAAAGPGGGGGATQKDHNPLFDGCRSVKHYLRDTRLQEGTYGVVYKAKDKRTGEVVALKKVKMNASSRNEGFPVAALRETNVLLALSHRNIVGVKEMVVGSKMDEVFMVMEYFQNDLKAVLAYQVRVHSPLAFRLLCVPPLPPDPSLCPCW